MAFLSRISHWKTLLQYQAIGNQCYISAANNVAGGEAPLGGTSMVCVPNGEKILELGDAEEVKQVEIDMRVIQTAREQIPIFQDRRPKLY